MQTNLIAILLFFFADAKIRTTFMGAGEVSPARVFISEGKVARVLFRPVKVWGPLAPAAGWSENHPRALRSGIFAPNLDCPRPVQARPLKMKHTNKSYCFNN
jgi:hypothetical protein